MYILFADRQIAYSKIIRLNLLSFKVRSIRDERRIPFKEAEWSILFYVGAEKSSTKMNDKLRSTSLTVIKRPAIKLSCTISNSNERYKLRKETFVVFASPAYFRFSSRQRQIAICIRKQCIQTSLRLGGRTCRFLLSRWLPILPSTPPAFSFAGISFSWRVLVLQDNRIHQQCCVLYMCIFYHQQADETDAFCLI